MIAFRTWIHVNAFKFTILNQQPEHYNYTYLRLEVNGVKYPLNACAYPKCLLVVRGFFFQIVICLLTKIIKTVIL